MSGALQLETVTFESVIFLVGTFFKIQPAIHMQVFSACINPFGRLKFVKNYRINPESPLRVVMREGVNDEGVSYGG